MEPLLELARMVEQSRPATAIRMVPWLYPALMALHVLGIALLVGGAAAFDARLLGLARREVPLAGAARLLLPLSRAGFALTLVTGLAMAAAMAGTVVQSAAAPVKFGLLLLAGVNVLVFHARVLPGLPAGGAVPGAARLCALASLVLWTGITFAGRWLAYA
ncbi:DUF6644 family protein [Oceanicella sp. SM1341]|uniref:DUF6644 family protein n=1 Tax=Oceanicella sp. SM1341 TaxID=1548889 RepID=UPI000E542204|nr:DUF6644 family protein [Oceanicella sp. SM1341]